MKRWVTVLLVLVLTDGAALLVLNLLPPRANPIRSLTMLTKDPNPVPVPRRVKIFSRLRRGDPEPFFAIRPWRRKGLRLDTTNTMKIRGLVDAMRETVFDEVPSDLARTNVVTYHLYFEPSDSEVSFYYQFLFIDETNKPSLISAYSTAGNIRNAEGLERWFATNNLLPAPEKE